MKNIMTFHKHFDTIQEMAKFRKDNPGGRSFWGSDEQILNTFVNGDDSLVTDAEKYINSLNDQLPETVRQEWHSDVFGPVVSVPDYLSNSPLPFLRMKEAESSAAPVRIIVSLTSSAGVKASVLRTRGLVILALLMKVQSVRPIDLMLYSELDCDGSGRGRGIVSLKIESKPLSIAHSIYALSEAMVARQIFYGVSDTESRRLGGSYNGGWPEGFNYGANNVEYYKWLNELFNVVDGDLVIPPTYLTDPIVNNPLGWINENLQRLVHFEE